MKQFLLSTYRYFQKHKALFYVLTVTVFILLGAIASRIKLEEDIARMLPDSQQTKQINDIFKHARFTDKIIVKIKGDTSVIPETLIELADAFETKLLATDSHLIAEIKSQVSDETALEVYGVVHTNLPIYLEEQDYKTIDSLINPQNIPTTLQNDYNAILSASGIIMKRMIADDPVGISTIALRKLQQLQIDDNFVLYDGHILAKDRRSIYLFITPVNSSGETGKNELLIQGIDTAIAALYPAQNKVEVLYFGGTAVAVGNARQLKKDTMLTLSITVVSILVFLWLVFRRKRVPVVMLLPVIFGALFSIACIVLIKGSISSIAIAAGSIVLGIAVNYSLHFFSHYKHCSSIEQTIADLLSPMTIGSFTTVGSFFCLTFLKSQILNDFGLFAALSLLGATVFALVFLPHFIPLKKPSETAHEDRLTKLLSFKIKYSGALFIVILLLTVFFYFQAKKVGFESDMNHLNFMDAQMTKAQKEVDKMQDDTSKTIFIASTGITTQLMLQHNEMLVRQLDTAIQNGWVNKYASFSKFMPSEQLQQQKIQRWNTYWTDDKKEKLLALLKAEGTKVGFKSTAFSRFENLLTKQYATATDADFEPLKLAFGNEYLIASPAGQTIINSVTVDKAKRKKLYAYLSKTPSTVILDKQIITNKFIAVIYNDFNAILLYSSLLVFVALLLSYGRLELTIITFLPMLISWIWILGIMGLMGLQFNIINIIISTFIFGLGDDFSIFITDGLTRKFKEGKEMLANHKVSIFLSATTTIIGLGALIFAKHPALKSIAFISIIGILCVLFIGQTVQPFLYNFFIQSRKDKGFAPYTIPTFFLTVFAFTYYVLGSLVLSLIGFVLVYLVPFVPLQKRKLWFHYLICYGLKSLTYIMVNVRKTHEGKEQMDFSKPAIIIANHASFLDILVTVMQHPKLILLTNQWVYHSPVFGKVVQLADYYPVMEGMDPAIDKFAAIVKDGYSIVVFPEGTRSPDGNLKRFHKGAFYLAEKLNIDIVPMLLHGTGDTIQKGDFMVFNASMTMKFLPRISPSDLQFGQGVAERTKSISRYFKTQYELLKAQKETPRYFKQRIIANYLYKGPELEWMVRKQIKNEDLFNALNTNLPKHGTILELGCGYGINQYMLRFLGPQRILIGVEASDEKIDVANNCYSKSPQLTFTLALILEYSLPATDAIIINAPNLEFTETEISQLIETCRTHLLPQQPLIFIGNATQISAYNATQIATGVYLLV